MLAQTADRHLVLIQDGARYHTSALTKAFFEEQKAHLTVFQLPTYSPDYNPIEKLREEDQRSRHAFALLPEFRVSDQEGRIGIAQIRQSRGRDFGFVLSTNRVGKSSLISGFQQNIILKAIVDNRRTRVLQKDEEGRLLAALAGKHACYKPVVILALQTGMRLAKVYPIV